MGGRSCQGRQPPKAGAAGQPLQDLPSSHTRPPRSTAGTAQPGVSKPGRSTQSNSMTFAVRGIPQHTFRELRFADLLFVTWRHRIPCFIEDGPQELDRRWIVCATIAHRVYSTVRPPFGINASLRPVECMTIEVTSCCKQCHGKRLALRKTHHDDGGSASMHTCHVTSGTLLANVLNYAAPASR